MEKDNSNNNYRLIQINNYVKNRKDYFKIKKAQKLSREILKKIQKEKLEKLYFESSKNEIIDQEEKICRICFEEETPTNKLIRPCKCKGTQRYIHYDCLMTWIQLNITNPEKRDYCDVCKYKFKYNTEETYIYDQNLNNQTTINNNNLQLEDIPNINYNFNIFLITHDIRSIFIRYLLMLIATFTFSGLDMFTNFILIDILTFGVGNQTIIKDNFNLIRSSNHSSVRGYMYFVYITYIISFIQTIILNSLSYYYRKHKYINNVPFSVLYYRKTKGFRFRLAISQNLFFIIFYLSIVSKAFFFMQMYILAVGMGILNLELFIFVHNKTIEEIQLDYYRRGHLLNLNRDDNINLDILEYSSETNSENGSENVVEVDV